MTMRDIDLRRGTVPAEVVIADEQIEALAKQARDHMHQVEDQLLHRQVRRHGDVYRVTRVGIARGGNHISLSGVRVRGGKTGTRVFDIGYAVLCEFITPAEERQHD